MEAAQLAEPHFDVQRRLGQATSQLALHTSDLRRAVETARKRARELAEANARLRILDRLKTDFLTFISHELRTPLTHLAAIDLIDPAGDPASQAKLLGVIRNGYERFEVFIRRGLEYFEWLAKDRVAAAGLVDLAALTQRVADGVPALANAVVGFTITAPGAPCLVRADEAPLAQCVRVLLDNAVKYGGRTKSIQIDVAAAGGRATVQVHDSGCGFPPELAREVFRPFTIADTDHHGLGTGLSLALASAIVHAYGGVMHAESKGAGTGATFTIELPAAASS